MVQGKIKAKTRDVYMKKDDVRRIALDLPPGLLGLLVLLAAVMLGAQLLLHIPAAARYVSPISPISDMEGCPLDRDTF